MQEVIERPQEGAPDFFRPNQVVLQKPFQYIDAFEAACKRGKDRAYIQSLGFVAGDDTNRVEGILAEAALRGVNSELRADHFCKMSPDMGLSFFRIPRLFWSKERLAQDGENMKALARLERGGVSYLETNPAGFLNRFIQVFGRDHRKFAGVDDLVAWMGGVNLASKSFLAYDFMVMFTIPEVVEAINDDALRINKNRRDKDHTGDIHPNYRFMSDSGEFSLPPFRDRSAIYTQVIDMIRGAKDSITFISPFVPQGRFLMELLRQASRGVKIQQITSTREFARFKQYPYRLSKDAVDFCNWTRSISGGKGIELYHLAEGQVHAKAIVVDGREALIGSHNFLDFAHMLRTQEAAIRSDDPRFVSQVYQFIMDAPLESIIVTDE